MPTRRGNAKSSDEWSWAELAKKRIEENKRTKAQFLDLASCGLMEIPAEIRDLVWESTIA
jgi:hypothetical protein